MRIYSVFNSALGDSSPFAPRSKMSLLGTLGAVVDIGSKIAEPILGAKANSDANRTNLEIARMNNEQQYKMFQEQNAFNLDMWNKNNEYNLPANQVKRLLAAGINPSAVFGSGSVTPSSQIQSATPPQLHSAQVRPFIPDLSGVGEAVNSFFDNQLKSKGTEGQGLDNQAKMIDNQYKAMHHIGDLLEQKHRIDEMISETGKNSDERAFLQKQSEYLGMQIQKFKDTYDLSVEREKLQNDVMRNQSDNYIADSTLKRAQASYQNMVIQFYPQMSQAQLAVLGAQFDDLVQSAALKAKDGQLRSAQAISQYIQNGIQAQDFEMHGYEYQKNKNKQEIQKSSKIIRGIQSSLDMIGETIFGNIKLFGK